MKTLTMVLIAGLLAVAATGRAQTLAELKAEAKTVEAQMMARRVELRNSPQVQSLRQAADAAETALRQATGAPPAVQKLDGQIAELRAQLRALTMQRQQLIEKDESLAGKRLAREQAAQALQTVTVNDKTLCALRQRCRELQTRIVAMEVTPLQ